MRTFLARQIVIVVALMLAYIAVAILLLRHLTLWTPDQATATVFWTISVAFVALMNVNSITEDEHYFRQSAIEQVKLLTLFEFVVNVYTFSLLVEIIIVPVIAVIAGMLVIIESDQRYKLVKRPLDFMLATFGLTLIVFSVYKISTDFEEFASSGTLRDFLVPALMSLAFLPFIYIMALYVRYENLFLRLSFFVQDKKLLGFIKRATFLAIHFRLNLLNKWARAVVYLRPQNKEDVRNTLVEFTKRMRQT